MITTALAATADAAGSQADPLTPDERRELRAAERAIERGAIAWLDMGRALRAVRDGRLYRQQYASFDAWLQAHRLEHSTAHQMIHAVAKYDLVQSIRGPEVPRIELDRESHYRPIPADFGPDDIRAVLQRVARKVTPDADGIVRPTAAAIRAAVKEDLTPPEDLARERERRRESAATRAHAAPPPMPADTGTPADAARLNGAATPRQQLDDLGLAIELLWNLHRGPAPEAFGFRLQLATMLRRLAARIDAAEPTPPLPAKRRPR